MMFFACFALPIVAFLGFFEILCGVMLLLHKLRIFKVTLAGKETTDFYKKSLVNMLAISALFTVLACACDFATFVVHFIMPYMGV